jgi:hypothetical protein
MKPEKIYYFIFYIITLAYPKTRKRKERKRKKIFKNENAETEKNFEILKFQGVFGKIKQIFLFYF